MKTSGLCARTSRPSSDAVAVLRAEWSLLNRPERIERLAEKRSELAAPARPQQLVTPRHRLRQRLRARPRRGCMTMRCRRHRALLPRSNPWPCLGLRRLPAPANLDDDLPAATKTTTVKTVPIKAKPVAQAAPAVILRPSRFRALPRNRPRLDPRSSYEHRGRARRTGHSGRRAVTAIAWPASPLCAELPSPLAGGW